MKNSLLKKSTTESNPFIVFVVAAIAIFISALLKGIGLSVLWAWFVAPLFGLPPLSIPMATGLALIPPMFAQMHTISGIKESGQYYEIFLGVFFTGFKVGLALSVGWIMLQFV